MIQTPDDTALVLQVFGFREIEAGQWVHARPLTIDDLMKLEGLLRHTHVTFPSENTTC